MEEPVIEPSLQARQGEMRWPKDFTKKGVKKVRARWQKGPIGKEDEQGKVGRLVKEFSQKQERFETSDKKHPPKATLTTIPTRGQKKAARVASKSSITPQKKDNVASSINPSKNYAAAEAKGTSEHKRSTLKSIFRRLKPPPHLSVKKAAKDLMASTGFTVGTLVYLIPFSDIVKNTNSTILMLRDLRRRGEATPKNVLRLLFRQAGIDTPLARDIITLGQASVFLARTIGSFAGTLGPVVLTCLRTALMSLGSSAGGLSLLFGGVQLTKGITGIIEAKKNLKAAKEERAKFNSKPPSTITGKVLKELRIDRMEKDAHSEMTKGILKISMGAFITVGGVLGIVSAPLGGLPALGIAIAGIVLGCVATAIDLADTIRQIKSDKERQKAFDEAFANIRSAAMNEPSWQNLAQELGIKASLPPKERMEALINYCFGEKAGALVRTSHGLASKTSLAPAWKMLPQTA